MAEVVRGDQRYVIQGGEQQRRNGLLGRQTGPGQECWPDLLHGGVYDDSGHAVSLYTAVSALRSMSREATVSESHEQVPLTPRSGTRSGRAQIHPLGKILRVGRLNHEWFDGKVAEYNIESSYTGRAPHCPVPLLLFPFFSDRF